MRESQCKRGSMNGERERQRERREPERYVTASHELKSENSSKMPMPTAANAPQSWSQPTYSGLADNASIWNVQYLVCLCLHFWFLHMCGKPYLKLHRAKVANIPTRYLKVLTVLDVCTTGTSGQIGEPCRAGFLIPAMIRFTKESFELSRLSIFDYTYHAPILYPFLRSMQTADPSSLHVAHRCEPLLSISFSLTGLSLYSQLGQLTYSLIIYLHLSGVASSLCWCAALSSIVPGRPKQHPVSSGSNVQLACPTEVLH